MRMNFKVINSNLSFEIYFHLRKDENKAEIVEIILESISSVVKPIAGCIFTRILITSTRIFRQTCFFFVGDSIFLPYL